MINVLIPSLAQFAWQQAAQPHTDIIGYSVRQVMVQSPLLLVYVVGLVLAVVFWKRSPTASICTMIGLILLLGTSIGFALLQNYFIEARLSQNWSSEDAYRAAIASSLVADVIRAGAFILIFVAIFVRRSPAAASNGPDYRTMRIK